MATTRHQGRATAAPERGLQTFAGALSHLWQAHAFLREIALVVLAALMYFGVRNLTVGAAAEAFANADRVVRLEERLRLDWEWALQNALVDHGVLETLFNWIYIWGHWPVIITAAVVLYRTRRDRYRLLRNAMFLSGAIGFLFFALLPVAPPRLVDPALIDTVTEQSDAYRALQPPGLTNQYAAFPSLHFGWNLLLGVVVYGSTRRALPRALSVIGPAAMALAVVVTANHFVVDLVGGAVIVLFSLWAVKRRQDTSHR